MRPRFPKFVAGGIAAALMTAAVGGAAFAQTPTPPTVTPQQRAQEFLNSIASKLGKTPTEVQSAVTAAQKERIAAEVAAGRLTQAQADQANQRIDQQGGLGLFGKGGPGGHGGPKGGRGGEVRGPMGGAEVATFLGVQPQELMQALQSGKSLAAYAQEKGKSRDDLKNYLTTQERTQLSQAVAAGRLTQAQADQRLTDFTSRLDQLVDRTGPVGSPRGRDGGRGPGGPRGGASANPGNPAAPSASPTARA